MSIARRFILKTITGVFLAALSLSLLASVASQKTLKEQIEDKQLELLEATLENNERRESLNEMLTILQQQDDHIDTLKEEVQLLEKKLNAKDSSQTTESFTSNLGPESDDVPCTCVFNETRAWNPKRIIWKERFWECVHYKEDGICTKVSEVEGSTVE